MLLLLFNAPSSCCRDRVTGGLWMTKRQPLWAGAANFVVALQCRSCGCCGMSGLDVPSQQVSRCQADSRRMQTQSALKP